MFGHTFFITILYNYNKVLICSKSL